MSKDISSEASPARRRSSAGTCAICGKTFPLTRLTPIGAIRPSLVERLRQGHPDLPADGLVCDRDLARCRSVYVTELLQRERGELSRLDREVIESMAGGRADRRQCGRRVRGCPFNRRTAV